MTDNIDLRNQLVVKYSYMVKYIVSKVLGNYKYFNNVEDVVNEGLVSLLQAVEKFDLNRNVKFETYASIKIRGAVIDYIRKQDGFPRRVKKIARTLNEAEMDLGNSLGYTPSASQLADFIGVDVKQLQKMQHEAYALNVLSFEQLVYESYTEDSRSEALLSSQTDMPENLLTEEELITKLSESVKQLNEKEQMVISLYYNEQLKIKEIAKVLKISDSRVSQIHSAAIGKLKSQLEKYLYHEG